MMQHAVDPEPDQSLVPTGFDMDVAGPLIEGIVEQPVDNVDHMRIVRIRVLKLPKLEHLLQVGHTRGLKTRFFRPGNRPGHGVELELKFGDIARTGDHALDPPAAQGLGEHALPLIHVGLRTGDHHLIIGNAYGQNVVSLGKGIGHHFRDRIDVDLQRVNAHVGLSGGIRQPQGKGVQVQLAPGLLAILVSASGNDFQGMLGKLFLGPRRNQNVFRLPLTDESFLHQLVQHGRQVKQGF